MAIRRRSSQLPSAEASEIHVPPNTLAVRGVTVVFGGVVALDDVSLQFTGPDVIGIVGPNGSGKSTLMGVMSGLVAPDRGSVVLNGTRLNGKSSVYIARRGLRRSFQNVRLVPTLTIRDNLLVGVTTVTPDILAHAHELAEKFGFLKNLHNWPSAVPAGTQRLVQVASIALTKPSVVLLDEPAAGLTDLEVSELASLIGELSKTGLVILVEHNMQLIYDIARRVVALINGRVAADGSVKDVQADQTFRSAYLGLAVPQDDLGPNGTAEEESAEQQANIAVKRIPTASQQTRYAAYLEGTSHNGTQGGTGPTVRLQG